MTALMSFPLSLLPILIIAAVVAEIRDVAAISSPRSRSSGINTRSNIAVKFDKEEPTTTVLSSSQDDSVNHDHDKAHDNNEILLDLIQMTGILDDPLLSPSRSSALNQNPPIIEQYQPQPQWLWSQFAGTVIASAWPTALRNMIWATAFCFFVRYNTYGDFRVFQEALETSATTFPLVGGLSVVDKIWTTLMGLTTFLLTFFVTQAYGFWRSFYTVTRSIQGRLNTIQMMLASHAARDTNPKKRGQYHGYTNNSYEFLVVVARRLRLFHLLHWSSQTRRFKILMTEKGLTRLVATGVLSEEEKTALDALVEVPITQKQYAILQATITQCQHALRNNKIMSVESKFLEHLLLDEFRQLRGQCASIPDLIDGRMPLAYAHFVQILVDTFVLSTPIAKYDSLGIFSVLMTGILSFFYQGLLMLAQVFLDPLDNVDYADGCLTYDLSVLLRESNAASAKWIYGGGATL